MAKLTSREYGRAEGAIRALDLAGPSILDLEQRNARLVEALKEMRELVSGFGGGGCKAMVKRADAVLEEEKRHD
jgi:hypothetical protein